MNKKMNPNPFGFTPEERKELEKQGLYFDEYDGLCGIRVNLDLLLKSIKEQNKLEKQQAEQGKGGQVAEGEKISVKYALKLIFALMETPGRLKGDLVRYAEKFLGAEEKKIILDLFSTSEKKRMIDEWMEKRERREAEGSK